MGRGVPLNQIILGVSTSRGCAGAEASRSRSTYVQVGPCSATPAIQLARLGTTREGPVWVRDISLSELRHVVIVSRCWWDNSIQTLRHHPSFVHYLFANDQVSENVYELDNDVAQGKKTERGLMETMMIGDASHNSSPIRPSPKQSLSPQSRSGRPH